MTNKKLGNSFEAEFCEVLSGRGYWVHNLAQNQAGQPADVMAVKDGKSYLIDCKVCSTAAGFKFSRIEDNQELSMQLWESCGNGTGWFALKVADEIYMVAYSVLTDLRETVSGLSTKAIRQYLTPLERWLEQCW